jgi:hypothetical protein
VIGAAGKDTKFFNATSNLAINISDKKHEILGSGTTSFNISMNLIPMHSQQQQQDDVENSHLVVKEEHNEEEEDEEEVKGSPDVKGPSITSIPELNLRINPNDTTLASSNLNSSVCPEVNTVKLSPAEIS